MRCVPFFLLAMIASGAALGTLGRRARERIVLPDRPPRSRTVDAALGAWAGGDREALAAFARDRVLPSSQHAADRAEIDFLEAVTRPGTRALAAVAERHPGTPAAARAAWVVVERTPAGAGRDALTTAFRNAHPQAWVVNRAPGR